MELSAPVRGVVEGGPQAVLGRCFRGGRGAWAGLGIKKGPGRMGRDLAVGL